MNCIYCHNKTTDYTASDARYISLICNPCNVLYKIINNTIGLIVLNAKYSGTDEVPQIIILLNKFDMSNINIGHGIVTFIVPGRLFKTDFTSTWEPQSENIINNLLWVFPQNFLSVFKSWHNMLIFK